MARAVDEQRRRELVQQCLPYLAEHGVAQMSLRPLAAALGTSDRMLIHYFGSKDELVGRVLTETRPKVPLLVAGHDHDVAAMARQAWKSLITTTGHQRLRYRVLLEVMALALTQPEPYERYARAAVYDWITPLATAMKHSYGLESDEANARATVLVSGLRGLATDRYLTSDAARTDHAARLLISTATTNQGSI